MAKYLSKNVPRHRWRNFNDETARSPLGARSKPALSSKSMLGPKLLLWPSDQFQSQMQISIGGHKRKKAKPSPPFAQTWLFYAPLGHKPARALSVLTIFVSLTPPPASSLLQALEREPHRGIRTGGLRLLGQPHIAAVNGQSLPDTRSAGAPKPEQLGLHVSLILSVSAVLKNNFF